MADIFHHFPIEAPAQRVYEAVTTPVGLDAWWTKRSSGSPVEKTEYELWFGPEHDWRALVVKAKPGMEFEWKLNRADKDWQGTRLRFEFQEQGGLTHVRFQHLGWPEANEHYRISCFCWAMYLRLLKRYVQFGETVPYEDRLEV